MSETEKLLESIAGKDGAASELYSDAENVADKAYRIIKQLADEVARLESRVRECECEGKLAGVPELVEALSFYMSICGNTAYSVTRESAMEAYVNGCAALAPFRSPA